MLDGICQSLGNNSHVFWDTELWMFSWESDNTGKEATPGWALSGPYKQHIQRWLPLNVGTTTKSLTTGNGWKKKDTLF